MKATLISWTNDPIETALTLWEASKTEDPLSHIVANANVTEDSMALFMRIMDQQIPVAQFITFNFVMENVPVSWREQAVRHRIGVKFGDNYAVDIVPEADISFWSQSMRIQSMATFADEEKYHIPVSIATSQADVAGYHPSAETTLDIYMDAMKNIQEAYRSLVELGIPMEDARELIPLGATHRIAMSINLQALKHIVGERGCWILQGSLWAPVIKSMIDELATKVHPIFRRLVAPPCVENGAFKSCVYKEENIRREDGRDALPICPLYVHYHGLDIWTRIDPEPVNARIPEYNELWGQNLTPTDWSWK